MKYKINGKKYTLATVRTILSCQYCTFKIGSDDCPRWKHSKLLICTRSRFGKYRAGEFSRLWYYWKEYKPLFKKPKLSEWDKGYLFGLAVSFIADVIIRMVTK